MTRWADETGRTVKTVTLSGTPKPSRPGDPAQHGGPREYFQVDAHRTRWHAASFAELEELAGREGWELLELAEIPTHAVIGIHDGKTVTSGDDGVPFDRDRAAAYAAERNAAGGGWRTHRVYLLADVTDQVLEEVASDG